MIELDVREKCHSCELFYPVLKTHKLMADDQVVEVSHIISCDQARLCGILENKLREEIKSERANSEK